jgi:hypothetical protein
MKKPEKPKTDNLGWITALLFPKKSKPTTPPQKDPTWMPKPAQPAPRDTAKANSTPAPQPAEVVKPAVTATPQVIHSVSAPPPQPAPIKPAATPPTSIQSQATPAAGQSQLTKSTPQTAEKSKQPTDVGKVMPTIWTVASILSLIVNIILIIVLVVLARELFVLKAIVGNDLLGGLYANFIYMDQAHIKTNITVAETIPINFTLPISQDTVVTLTKNTPINGANVKITSGGLTINSAANIVLPAGTNLPVHLELNVPVSTTIPIKLNVPVDIPLEQTELHKPFVGLQQVVAPFYKMLLPDYKKATDMPVCKPVPWLCNLIFATP